MSFWDSVKSFFSGPLGAESEVEEEERPLVRLLHPLDVLRHEAIKEQEQAVVHEATFQSVEEREVVRHHQDALRADILALHAQLETGLSLENLKEMSESLREHCQGFQAPRPDELDELAMLSIMADFHRRALEWAWTDFEQRLEKAGLPWPEPTGISPHADSEEIERHREYGRREMRDTFLSGYLRRFPDLLVGVVPAWRHLYPKRGGPVWVKAVYQAVAAALAYRRLTHLEQLAEQEKECLERLVTEALEEELRPVQEQLRVGVGSIVEARRLSDQAVSICQRVAPAVVWEHLKDRV